MLIPENKCINKLNSFTTLAYNIWYIFTDFDRCKLKKKSRYHYLLFFVPGAGIEPAQPCSYWCLRPARLPIPPSGHLLSVKLDAKGN